MRKFNYRRYSNPGFQMMRITFKELGLELNAQFLQIEANYHCNQIAVVDMVEEEETQGTLRSTCLEEQWMHQPAEPSLPCVGACHPQESSLQLSARRAVQPQFAAIKLSANILSTTFPQALTQAFPRHSSSKLSSIVEISRSLNWPRSKTCSER